MPRETNIQLHLAILSKARQLPAGTDKRIALVNRSICGIIRARKMDYNPDHL